LNGSVFVIALNLSFHVRIYHSISGTCSSQAVVFRLMPIVSMCFLMYSYCLSVSMCHILNPLPWYVLITCWSDLMIVDFLSSFIISIVLKHIARDIVMMNGILLMYMMSVVSVTIPCSSSIPSGRLCSLLSVTCSRVFPCSFLYMYWM